MLQRLADDAAKTRQDLRKTCVTHAMIAQLTRHGAPYHSSGSSITKIQLSTGRNCSG